MHAACNTAARGLATPSKAASSPPSWNALPVTMQEGLQSEGSGLPIPACGPATNGDATMLADGQRGGEQRGGVSQFRPAAGGNQRLVESVGEGWAGAAGSASGSASGSVRGSKWLDAWVWPEEKASPKEKALLSLPSKGAGSEAIPEAQSRGGDGGDVDVREGVRPERAEQGGASSHGDAVQLPGLGERGASKSPTPSHSPARSPFHE